MVQLSPDTHILGWDASSGYHYDDDHIYGFSHTHLSGTGIGDLGDVALLPFSGGDSIKPVATFKKDTEKATPGYYAVRLDNFGINVELTSTDRVGFHKYTYDNPKERRVLLDLGHILQPNWGHKLIGNQYLLVNDSTVEGTVKTQGWAHFHSMSYRITFSEPIETVYQYIGGKLRKDSLFLRLNTAEDLKFHYKFAEKAQPLYVKVALSVVDPEGAEKNLEAELPGWDFDKTREESTHIWNEALNLIQIEADPKVMVNFYTALYHTMVAPSEFCDVNGDYRGADGQVRTNPGHKTYTTFSLWDTYRAAMPLMTILHPDRMPDVIRTMLAIADEQGRLPVWHLWGNETDCMVGNPGIPVVADAIVKGIGGFDREQAFEAIRKTAMNPDRGNGLRMKHGYIPCDLFNEAVAYDMEYALADGAAARAAEALGKTEDAAYFTGRSHSYRNYFDSATRFMRGRDAKGGWRTPFNPFASTHRADDYCEGNAWHYNWSVFHDVQGLINLYGSDEAFTQKIDSVFTLPNTVHPGTYGGMIHEMKEMQLAGMGQYAHGNQPIQHMIYLYSYAGQPWKTQYWSRQITSRLYNSSERGFPGDEDQGGMSSWYVLSALGIYSVCPGTDQYVLGSPVFGKATITTEEGRQFVIEAENNAPDHVYIQSATLNGEPLDRNWITYDEITRGGTLHLVMGPEPNLERGTSKQAAPFSLSKPE